MSLPKQQPKQANLITGKVVKKSGKQTVAVEVERSIEHPIYRKQMKRTTRYLVHDPREALQVGDMATIKEVRPISKRKRWLAVYESKAETK